MHKRIVTDLTLRVLIPAVGSTAYFFIAHYLFAFEKAKAYAITIGLVSITILIIEYVERNGWIGNQYRMEISKSKRILQDVTKRLLFAIVGAAIVFIASQYGAHDRALYNAVMSAIAIAGLLLVPYVGRKGWDR